MVSCLFSTLLGNTLKKKTLDANALRVKGGGRASRMKQITPFRTKNGHSSVGKSRFSAIMSKNCHYACSTESYFGKTTSSRYHKRKRVTALCRCERSSPSLITQNFNKVYKKLLTREIDYTCVKTMNERQNICSATCYGKGHVFVTAADDES